MIKILNQLIFLIIIKKLDLIVKHNLRGLIMSISDLKNFPFNSYQDFYDSIRKNKIWLAVHPQAAIKWMSKSRSIYKLLALTPLLISIFILLTIISYKLYWILIFYFICLLFTVFYRPRILKRRDILAITLLAIILITTLVLIINKSYFSIIPIILVVIDLILKNIYEFLIVKDFVNKLCNDEEFFCAVWNDELSISLRYPDGDIKYNHRIGNAPQIYWSLSPIDYLNGMLSWHIEVKNNISKVVK